MVGSRSLGNRCRTKLVVYGRGSCSVNSCVATIRPELVLNVDDEYQEPQRSGLVVQCPANGTRADSVLGCQKWWKDGAAQMATVAEDGR